MQWIKLVTYVVWHYVSEITQCCSKSDRIYPTALLVVFVCECETSEKSDVSFWEMIRLKSQKITPKSIRCKEHIGVSYTLRLEFCTECMLSLNMGLAGLSEITCMSEIRRVYPNLNCVTSGALGAMRCWGTMGWMKQWMVAGDAKWTYLYFIQWKNVDIRNRELIYVADINTTKKDVIYY